MSTLTRWGVLANPTATAYTMDASENRIAGRLQYAPALVPRSVAIYVAAVSGTPPTYTVKIVTDNGAGLPTNTLYDAAATVNFTPTSTGWKTVTFVTAPAAMVVGTIYHIVVEYSVGAIDAGNKITVGYLTAGPFGTIRAHTALSSAAVFPPVYSEIANNAQFCFALTFTDGTVISQGCHASGTDYDIWGTRRGGLRFQMPVTTYLLGMGLRIKKTGAPTDLVLKIVDSAGATIASRTIDADTVKTTALYQEIFWGVTVQLTANSTHRLIAHTSGESEASAANSYQITYTAWGDAAWSFDGATSFWTTGASDTGTWTDTDTQDPILWLILDSLVGSATSLNTVDDILDEGNWQADAWSPRIVNDTEYRTWIGTIAGRANNYVKYLVGTTYYKAQAGSVNEGIFREAEMQFIQYLILMSAATIADTSDADGTAPFLKDGDTLRLSAAERKVRFDTLMAPFDTTKGRPGRLGPYFVGKRTATSGVRVERFDPDTGLDDDGDPKTKDFS